jgi:hypothetical protein
MALVWSKTSLETGLLRGGFGSHFKKLGTNHCERVPVCHGLGFEIEDGHESRYLIFVYLTRRR